MPSTTYAEPLTLDLIQIDPGVCGPVVLDGGDWLLCSEGALSVTRILRHYRAMPALFLAHEKRVDSYWRTVLRATVSAAREDERARLRESGYSLPELLMWVGIVGAVALAAGAVLGLVLGATAD